MEKEKIVLPMTLEKEWFRKIACVDKNVEFREVKKFWIDRLLNKDKSFKSFDLIHFRNGYGSSAPFMCVEFLDIKILSYEEQPLYVQQRFKGADVFAINLGKVLELRC